MSVTFDQIRSYIRKYLQQVEKKEPDQLIQQIEHQDLRKSLQMFFTGIHQHITGQYEECINSFSNVISVLNSILSTNQSYPKITHILLGLSKIYTAETYWRLNNINSAKQLCEETIQLTNKELLTETGKKWLQFYIFRLRGILYWIDGDLENSINILLEGIELAETMKYQIYSAALENTLGYMYREQGKLRTSRQYFEMALPVLDQYGIEPYLAKCMENLAMIYHKYDRAEESENLFTKAIAIREKLGDPFELSGTLFYKCLMYYNSEDKIDEFTKTYQELQQVVEDVDIPVCEQRLLVIKGLKEKRRDRYAAKQSAKKIFTKLINQSILYEIEQIASLAYVEILIEEYQLFKNEEILRELKDILTNLLEEAHESKAYGTQVSLHALNAQLELFLGHDDKSEESLRLAKEIIIKENLHNSEFISSFEDHLIEYRSRKRVENIIDELPGEFHYQNIIGQVIFNKSISETLVDEHPITFLILDPIGNLFYSKILRDISIKEHLIANFISAILSFSEEMIDMNRANTKNIVEFTFNEYTIFLQVENDIIFSYIFSGAELTALPKFSTIVEDILSNDEIVDTLKNQSHIAKLFDNQINKIDQIISKHLSIGQNQSE